MFSQFRTEIDFGSEDLARLGHLVLLDLLDLLQQLLGRGVNDGALDVEDAKRDDPDEAPSEQEARQPVCGGGGGAGRARSQQPQAR